MDLRNGECDEEVAKPTRRSARTSRPANTCEAECSGMGTISALVETPSTKAAGGEDVTQGLAPLKLSRSLCTLSQASDVGKPSFVEDQPEQQVPASTSTRKRRRCAEPQKEEQQQQAAPASSHARKTSREVRMLEAEIMSPTRRQTRSVSKVFAMQRSLSSETDTGRAAASIDQAASVNAVMHVTGR